MRARGVPGGAPGVALSGAPADSFDRLPLPSGSVRRVDAALRRALNGPAATPPLPRAPEIAARILSAAGFEESDLFLDLPMQSM
jgi:hypothetical protein